MGGVGVLLQWWSGEEGGWVGGEGGESGGGGGEPPPRGDERRFGGAEQRGGMVTGMVDRSRTGPRERRAGVAG